MTIAIISERPAGIERFVYEVIVRAAVELIGAGSHGDIDVAAAHLPVLRGVIAGLNSDLLNRIHAGLGLRRNAGRAGRSRARGCTNAP